MDHLQNVASRLVLHAAPGLEAQLRSLAAKRMVFFAGLPGTGKSLLVHQLVHLALGAGRSVHLLQWDVARPVFEASPAGRRYPLTDGVTHAVIRKAAGLWVRQALVAWNERHPGPEHLLIGETPFIGSRFIELARSANMGGLAAGPPSPPTLGAPRQSRGAPRECSDRLLDNRAEAVLTSASCRFVIAVPSRDVRRFLEAERERRSANPLHPREREDAPPRVLRDLWRELAEVAGRLGLSAPSDDYDPAVYRRVYETILRHRNVEIVPLDVILPTGALSVYDFAVDPLNLVPTEDETGAFIASVERRYPDRTVLDREIDGWWEG